MRRPVDEVKWWDPFDRQIEPITNPPGTTTPDPQVRQALGLEACSLQAQLVVNGK
jgi:hypothetical protein